MQANERLKSFCVESSASVDLDRFGDVASFVPKFLGFLVILLIGYLVAKAIAKIADTVLERVGFDRVVERGGIGRAMGKAKYDPSDVIAKVIFYALLLIVLQMAFGVFGTNPVSDLIEGVIVYLPKVVAAMLIIVVAAVIAAAVKELIEAAVGGLSYGKALAAGVSIAILVVGAFAALDQLQIAEDIVNGLFYALLAIVAGPAIIAIGGGGIGPMRQRWERALQRLTPRCRMSARRRRGEGPRHRAAQERVQQVQSAKAGDTGSSRPS